METEWKSFQQIFVQNNDFHMHGVTPLSSGFQSGTGTLNGPGTGVGDPRPEAMPPRDVKPDLNCVVQLCCTPETAVMPHTVSLKIGYF